MDATPLSTPGRGERRCERWRQVEDVRVLSREKKRRAGESAERDREPAGNRLVRRVSESRIRRRCSKVVHERPYGKVQEGKPRERPNETQLAENMNARVVGHAVVPVEIGSVTGPEDRMSLEHLKAGGPGVNPPLRALLSGFHVLDPARPHRGDRRDPEDGQEDPPPPPPTEIGECDRGDREPEDRAARIREIDRVTENAERHERKRAHRTLRSLPEPELEAESRRKEQGETKIVRIVEDP
jgi:hypothetical protein